MPISARWTSGGWACRRTTSPTTSRSCSAPTGFGEVEDVVGTFFAEVDDDQVQRLTHDATATA